MTVWPRPMWGACGVAVRPPPRMGVDGKEGFTGVSMLELDAMKDQLETITVIPGKGALHVLARLALGRRPVPVPETKCALPCEASASRLCASVDDARW